MKNLIFCLSLAFNLVFGLNDGLCPTPPMGFSSWNAFKQNIDQEKIINTVDAIKKLKLEEYGYNYVIIDDLWSTAQRNPTTQNLQGVFLSIVGLNMFPFSTAVIFKPVQWLALHLLQK